MSDISLLIVEDERLIAFTLENALNAAGYGCAVASTGQAALDLLNQDASCFKAVLTDIRLGKGPDGWEVARRARELVPGMPVIYVSGDSAAGWRANGVTDSLMIPKPYAFAQIITAVSNMLDPGPAITASGATMAGEARG